MSSPSEQPAPDAAEYLRAVIDSSGDGIYTVDREGRCTFVNETAAQLLDYAPEELLGKNMHALIHQNRSHSSLFPHAACLLIRTIQQGTESQCDDEVFWRKDGTPFAVNCAVRPLILNGQRVGAMVTFGPVRTDVAQKQRELQELQETSENRALVLRTASRVALDILASRTGVEALRHIAEAARTLSRAKYAAVGVAYADGLELMEFVTVGLSGEEEARIGPRPQGKGILRLLLTRTEPLRIDALSKHPNSAGFPPNHPPMDSFLGVPIRRGDTVLGSLYLTNKEGGGSFTEADEVAVQALGAYAAVAIHNLHLLTRQRALVSGLLAAQEEERRVIAYDLHDGLTQYVMASHAHLDAFRKAYQAGNIEKANREMEQGMRYLKEAVIESRRQVNGLRLLALDDLGLAGALEQLINEEKARVNWQQAEFIHNIAGRRFEKTLETAVYRVAQEALTNVRKHARSPDVRLVLLQESEGDSAQLMLEIRDWGRGFTPEEKSGDYGHLGLQGMVERTTLMGGSYEIHSAPGEGTVVNAIFPILPAQRESSEGDAE